MKVRFPAFLAGLLLTACGGAASPASSATAAPPSLTAAKPAAVNSAAPGGSAGTTPAGSVSAAASGPVSAKPSAAVQTTAVTLALGYIPNVQFAPFYVAQAKGIYKDAGLDVSFDNGISPDLIKSVGAGKFKIALADADTVISAREQGIPVVYVA
ncbi:MAG TPA: ABC transporter substrate-binding protein, partial [Chloroflexota bacterium]|nr:ABC transporter substrate-binding protein [Chloroflexota bacterium]